MEKIKGINPCVEILKSDKTIEKIEIYKGVNKSYTTNFKISK